MNYVGSLAFYYKRKPMIICVKLLLMGGPVGGGFAFEVYITVVSQQCLSVSMSLLCLQEDFC